MHNEELIGRFSEISQRDPNKMISDTPTQLSVKERMQLWKQRDAMTSASSPSNQNNVNNDLMVVEINFGNNKSEEILVRIGDDPEKLAKVRIPYHINRLFNILKSFS